MSLHAAVSNLRKFAGACSLKNRGGIHSFVLSFIRSFVHSLIHSIIHSFIQSFAY